MVSSSGGTGPGRVSVGRASASASTFDPDPGVELAVAGGERLVLEVPSIRRFSRPTMAPSTGPRSVDGRPVGLDRHLLEHEAGDVLRSVHVADLRVGGHDHPRRPVLAGEPGALGVGDHAVLVVERRPRRSTRPRRRRPGRSSRAPPRGCARRGRRRTGTPASRSAVPPLDGLGLGEQRRLVPSGWPSSLPSRTAECRLADREQRVGDGGRVENAGSARSTRSLSGAVGDATLDRFSGRRERGICRARTRGGARSHGAGPRCGVDPPMKWSMRPLR